MLRVAFDNDGYFWPSSSDCLTSRFGTSDGSVLVPALDCTSAHLFVEENDATVSPTLHVTSRVQLCQLGLRRSLKGAGQCGDTVSTWYDPPENHCTQSGETPVRASGPSATRSQHVHRRVSHEHNGLAQTFRRHSVSSPSLDEDPIVECDLMRAIDDKTVAFWMRL